MKRIILLLGIAVSLIASLDVLTAQNASEGVINYEVKINMHRRLPKEREEMKAMIPEFRTEKQQLFFNSNESLYKKVEEDNEDDMSSGGHGGPTIRMQAPKIEIYLDNASQLRTQKQEFMGKEYLIVDTLQVSPWKFGTEMKTIQGYECKQAYYTDETLPEQKMEVTAWYTDKIRPFLGPERFQTLPGTILAVDINNGERVLVAKTIEFRPLKKNEMKIPSGGVKTTQAQFRTMVDEQIKKMGGSGGMIIRN
ncbi:MAG TPA: GLPGLI family protein [Cyclobacteriaceae bacterium]|nr:GLPGLI family protein [Cyclobacteriaceae bacterium]